MRGKGRRQREVSLLKVVNDPCDKVDCRVSLLKVVSDPCEEQRGEAWTAFTMLSHS